MTGLSEKICFSLRPTQAADLDFVFRAEQNDQNRAYITPWQRETHEQALSDPKLAHLVVQHETPVGFVILAGLLDANRSLEFRRIVITEKGKGYGRQAIALVQQLAFETYQAHRLWLDVKVDNHRARAIYQASGFVQEGVLRECLKSAAGYESLVIMSMLRQEYSQRQTSGKASQQEANS